MQFAAITVITVIAGVAVMAITVMAVATVTVIIDTATNDKPNSYHFCNICIRNMVFGRFQAHSLHPLHSNHKS